MGFAKGAASSLQPRPWSNFKALSAMVSISVAVDSGHLVPQHRHLQAATSARPAWMVALWAATSRPYIDDVDSREHDWAAQTRVSHGLKNACLILRILSGGEPLMRSLSTVTSPVGLLKLHSQASPTPRMPSGCARSVQSTSSEVTTSGRLS